MIVKRFIAGVVSTNCYLFYNDGATEAVLVDPAKGYRRIKAFCDSIGLKVKAVLITHGHFDHILEASLWKADGAKIYIHRLDGDKLFTDKNLAYMIRAEVPPCEADVLLEDGDSFKVAGFEISVIHTPGHSIGSVCYLTEGVMFSGDTLFSGDYGRTDFPDGSIEDLKNSIKKLFALPSDYRVLPGHDEETTLGEERRTNLILRYL
jgi:Zn-dependent hydrolases, including glyoxylases